MSRIIPRAPTPHDEFAYDQWLDSDLCDARCEHCGSWVPEAAPHIHDVQGKPRTLYCSLECWQFEQEIASLPDAPYYK